MVAQDVVTPEEDIWNQILSESTRKVNANNIESHSVVILGDRNCGKSSLLSRMQHEDSDVNKGVALTYSFVDVYESENEDPTGRIDFWQLEGEVAHKELLQFGLQEKTVANALVVIALDLSQPWTMVEALKRWLGVLQTHLEGVYANLEVEGPLSKTALQEKLRASFQTYREPSSSEATTAKKKKTHSSHAVDVSTLPPVEKNVLSNNLGVPIIVVCCKCDSMVSLEKDFDYNEGIFEYIQQYLRRICLNYGAGLIYTSAKKDTNCDLLLEYIQHVLFGFEFHTRCQLLEKESIFVPAGWDSMPKITLDFENQKVCKDPDEPFENVIKKPSMIKRREQTHISLATADDDQEFLQKHKSKLDTDTDKKEEFSDKAPKGIMDQLVTGIIAPLPTDPSPEEEKDTRPPKKPEPKATGTPPPTIAKEAAEKKALTDFFTSLMGAKKPAAAKAPTDTKDMQEQLNRLKQQAKK